MSMMLPGFPRDKRVLFRNPTPAFRGLINQLPYFSKDKWKGSRITVIHRRDLSVKYSTVHVISLHNGYEGEIYGANHFLPPGTVGLVMQNRGQGWETGTPYIYINEFTANDDERDILLIARDAVFEAQDGNMREALRIAGEILPHGAGLFVAMCEKESRLLRAS